MPIYLAELKTIDQLLPKRGPNTYSSGLKDYDKGFVKYGPKSTDEPILIIADPIFDEDRNAILPGYYELSLSKDRANLILSQSEKIIAVIPVFKLEEDRTQDEPKPMDKKSQRKFEKAQKKKEKENKKLIKEGKMPTEPEIYNHADIEYDVKGDYYLVKYERGKIRAWGALKFKY